MFSREPIPKQGCSGDAAAELVRPVSVAVKVGLAGVCGRPPAGGWAVGSNQVFRQRVTWSKAN